ncbi:uncharacterized protein LOC142974705 isoform X2 [Anticarsia gemmatalis]|uniref:uncharacterized protein LOC142974705 isoform X2 n=1 Tax=Anticarsia gemmatalis TaxID=129554 RepID=UPI003F773062
MEKASEDVDTKIKKAHRVRSWYLYEQYKSLEDHQLNAAQKLKDKSYQEKILRQEILERRARRKLYDQFPLCQSEPGIKRKIKSESGKASVSVSSEFFESFSDEPQDEEITRETEFEDIYSEDSNYSKSYSEELKMANEREENTSYSESANSIVENAIPDEINVCKCKKEDQFTSMTIAQDINKQMNEIKQNFDSMENIAKLQDFDKNSEMSVYLDDNYKINKNMLADKHENDFNNNVSAIWSRLVSFAYQIVQLNHGNCYCDYSSQFLTAVLACDVLCRSVNRMCNILQPYVSPIKFATDESDASDDRKDDTAKKSAQTRKSSKTFEYKLYRRNKRFERSAHRNYSEHCSQSRYRRLLSENPSRMKKHSRASEPWRRVIDDPFKDMSSQTSSSSCSIWSQNYTMKNMPSKSCSCHKKPRNPMIKLAHIIDTILKDVEDSNAYL